MLVATTIIESGLDIPNANTLIIDRADVYGLSQLHQLRGRVGRGAERAYAYFLYPPEHALTETAHERLATVAQHWLRHPVRIRPPCFIQLIPPRGHGVDTKM